MVPGGLARSRGLRVTDMDSGRLVIGTAGHIDHGKSALVRALTGIEPDRLKEEQERGITIDLGFAHTDADGVTLAFVDVPGHERFVRNMLAGATGIDAVLMVVAADESVMPQTREHLDICRLLDVRLGIVALTKADAADADLRAVARAETSALVAGTFLDGAPMIDVSAVTGEGLDVLARELAALARRAAPRPADGVVRLPVDRAFTLRGFGTVVTGTLVAGRIRPDDVLSLLPGGHEARVRGLHVHGKAVVEARAGQRVAVNLGDVRVSDVARGDTLTAPGAFEPTRCVDVRLEVLPDAPALSHGARVRVHQGTSEVMGRVAIGRVLASPGRDAAPAAQVPPGSRAHARIRLEAPVVVTRGDRFVLRSYSPVATIGGGLVLDPLPRRTGIRTATARARFEALDPGAEGVSSDAAAARACRAIVSEDGRDGSSMGKLGSRLGLAGPALVSLVDRGVAAGDLVRLGDRVLAAAAWHDIGASLLALVRAHLEEAPHSDGLPREEARDQLRVAPRVLDAVLDELLRTGALTGRDRLALPGRKDVSDADATALAAVEEVLATDGLMPSDRAELPGRTGLDAATVDRVLLRLARLQRVVQIAGLPFHRTALDRLVADIRGLKASGSARVDVASFKARYGLSRKFAIPLLEFLDRERVTRRMGADRIVL